MRTRKGKTWPIRNPIVLSCALIIKKHEHKTKERADEFNYLCISREYRLLNNCYNVKRTFTQSSNSDWHKFITYEGDREDKYSIISLNFFSRMKKLPVGKLALYTKDIFTLQLSIYLTSSDKECIDIEWLCTSQK